MRMRTKLQKVPVRVVSCPDPALSVGAGHETMLGRLSFHPIPCGSRDRPVGRKGIDEGKIMC